MSVTCPTCKEGSMTPDRIYRLSGCLVMIGYFLLIPGILMILGGIGFTFLGIGAAPSAMSDGLQRARDRAVADMRSAGIDGKAVAEMEKTGSVSATTKAAMSPADRQKVDRILSSKAAMNAGTAVGSAGVAVCGGAFTMATFVIGIPTFIVGFLLILKRNVLRCPSCGFVVDRA